MTTAALRGSLNRLQGGYGEAFVDVLAAAAGVSSARPYPDNGFDRSVGPRFAKQSPIELQIKTESNPTWVKRELRFALDVAAYDLLRSETTSGRFLVVVVVPPVQTEWVSDSGVLTVLRRRAYFQSLRGSPETLNTKTITVSLPLCNVLTPQVLTRLTEGGVA